MTLGELIAALSRADPNYVAPIGLGATLSWRGDRYALAFEPVENVSVADMLATARSALGSEMPGYRGGTYRMHENVSCYIDRHGSSKGDRIGPVLVAYLTGQPLQQ